MKSLQILMPMGGLGSRYAKAGYTTPKPLIPVDNMPMFLKAASSLKNIPYDKRFIFVIRKDHVINQQLDTLIKEALPSAQIVVLDHNTSGAAESALAAESILDPNAGLVIMDCDLWFSSDEYEKMIIASLSGKRVISGGLLTFNSSDPRYSYVLKDSSGYAIRTAEKDPISHNAITGAYFFSTASGFINAAKQLVARPISNKLPEYYLSLTYNILLKQNPDRPVVVTEVDEYASFGTPEELKQYASR